MLKILRGIFFLSAHLRLSYYKNYEREDKCTRQRAEGVDSDIENAACSSGDEILVYLVAD